MAKNVRAMLAVQYDLYKKVKPLIFFGMAIFAIPLILLKRGGPFVSFLVVTYFVSAAAWVVVMIMPGSDPRHEEVFAFIPLLVTILGIAMLSKFFAGIRFVLT